MRPVPLERRPPPDAPNLAQALSNGGAGEVELVEHPSGAALSLRPRTADEVSRAVTIAARLGARVAATRRVRPGLVALDLGALSGMEAPDETSCLVRVGSGARVRDVEGRAIQAGLTLGPLLPSSPNKKVGAWLAGPTRGERAIPGIGWRRRRSPWRPCCRTGRSTDRKRPLAAPPGRILDFLLLGGEGRFGLITRATLRLFPRALAEALGMRPAITALEAVESVHAAVNDGLWPAEARWERGLGTLEVRFTGAFAAQRARRFGTGAIAGHELRGHLELAGSWRAWRSLSPLRPDALQLVAIHGDGAFGAIAFESAEESERAAVHARAIGFAVVSPRSLRVGPESGFESAGIEGVHEALARQLDPLGVFAP